MRAETGELNPREIIVLLRGDPGRIAGWTERLDARRLALPLGVIVAGAGLYGTAMGWWRDPQQALYVAIKFPLIILLTTGGNTLLDAMLAPLLGLNLPFRQSFLAILMSFTIAAMVLGAFSPLAAFVAWNAPATSPGAVSGPTYHFIKLAHVAAIAFAGVAGNIRLFQLLAGLGRSRTVARRVLIAWLAGNLFLGSQLSWMLRPFIGSPGLPVEFLRHGLALQGNFYENVFRTLLQLLQMD